MLSGSVYVFANVTKAAVNNSRVYKPDAGAYSETLGVTLRGIVEGKSTDELRIKGRRGNVGGLHLFVAVEVGEPITFPNPAEEQTLCEPGALGIDVVKAHMGWMEFASIGGEPEQMVGTALVSQSMFQNMWQWCQLGCPGVAKVGMHLFGRHMSTAAGWRGDYQWDAGEGSGHPLFMSGFDFMTRFDKADETTFGKG